MTIAITDRPTRNIRTMFTIPAQGAHMISPAGIDCWMLGPDDASPGKYLLSRKIDGKEFVHSLWPAQFRRFTIAGEPK